MKRTYLLAMMVVLVTGLVASAQYPPEKPRGVRPATAPRAGSLYAHPGNPTAFKSTASKVTHSSAGQPFNPFGVIRDEDVVPTADNQPIRSTPPLATNATRKMVARPAVRATTTSTPAPTTSATSEPTIAPRTASLPKRAEPMSPGELLPEHVVPRSSPAAEPTLPARGDSQPSLAPVDSNAPRATTANAPSSTASAAPAANRLVLTRRAPQLTVEATGPRRMTVGKETLYNVTIRNHGDEAAENVLVLMGVPAGVEVRDATAPTGIVAPSSEANQPGIEWRLDRVSAQAKLELTLKLVARQSQPFDLKLQWICSPAGAQALVEVEEPRLQLNITGPSEVVYGQPQTYKLTISNPGNGTAENATIYLLPLDAREGQPASQNLGNLAAGASRSVEIELVPRQSGQLAIRAEATADSELKTATQHTVRVRRGELRVAVTGPRQVLAGVPANYEVRIQNTGDAPAQHVHLATQLPGGIELLNVTQPGQQVSQRNEVQWKLEQLAAGGEQVFHLKAMMRTGGSQRLAAAASADGELHATAETTTQVTAYPDLTLEVSDSPGPIALGQLVTYDVRVKNRGTGVAEGLELTAYFSEGIEPTQVEGGAGEMGAGVVTIRPGKALAPNGEMLYRIKAKATTAGHHKIRVELGCQTLGSKVTQEDTTLFYSDASEPMAAASPSPLVSPANTPVVPR